MSRDLVSNVVAFALQTCVIAAAAALLLRVVHIGSAGARYVCWRIALAVCLAAPVLLQQVPAPEVAAVPPSRPVPAAVTESVARASVNAAADSVVPSAPAVSWPLVLLGVLAAGGAVRAVWLTIGLVRLRTLRRGGTAVHDADYAEIQATLGTRAELKTVEGLTQPATFGIWRPVVLLPPTLADRPVSMRRAVVTHELFHVIRRDWLWVLSEEMIRTVLWFHPPIVWLTSRIQLAREELVDELTVLATGNRKAYIEALFAFADAGRARPAAAFARPRQLFTRIVRLSKEGSMSSPRIIVSAGVVIASVIGASWYASQVFPIVSAATELPAPVVPRIQSSGSVTLPAPDTGNEAWVEYMRAAQDVLGRVVAQGPRGGGAPRPGPAPVVVPPAGIKPITPENPIPRRLSSVAVPYPPQLRGSGLRASLVFRVTVDASGAVSDVQRFSIQAIGNSTVESMTAFLTTASDAIRQWRYQPPADPPIAFFVSVSFEEGRDAVTSQSERAEGLAGARIGGSPAVAISPSGAAREQVLAYERRLAELQASRSQTALQFGEADPRVRTLDGLIAEVRDRFRELERRVQIETGDSQAVPSGRTPWISPTGQSPIRVGGTIRPPAKLRHVNPAYPPIAQSARVQGVVILETIIDEQGRVADVRVLRSIPLLDQAAVDAVRQWEFEPTHLNGMAVPIIMTVTVQFSLPSEPVVQ